MSLLELGNNDISVKGYNGQNKHHLTRGKVKYFYLAFFMFFSTCTDTREEESFKMTTLSYMNPALAHIVTIAYPVSERDDVKHNTANGGG